MTVPRLIGVGVGRSQCFFFGAFMRAFEAALAFPLLTAVATPAAAVAGGTKRVGSEVRSLVAVRRWTRWGRTAF
jgi:hypothetical protein